MYFKMLRIYNARYEHLKDTFTITMLEAYKYIQNETVTKHEENKLQR